MPAKSKSTKENTEKKVVFHASPYQDIYSLSVDKIEQLIKKNSSGGLIDILIDNMAMLISSQGSLEADQIIKDVINELSAILNEKHIVVRTSRDHIHILLSDMLQSEVYATSEKIYKIIQDYGCKDSQIPIYLNVTMGVADFPGTVKSAREAIDSAFVALSDAKEKSMHIVSYNDAKKHTIEATNKLVLANYFQDALINKKLRLAYQPIIDTKSGNVSYYECLLRIVSPNGTTSSAGPFIPIAEKMGFIDLIDSLVLNMVVEDLKLSPTLKLSMNLSNVTIQDPKWLGIMTKLLQDRVVAKRMIIEIIETSEQYDTKQVLKFINTVRELGCQISLDDFGTGYTSFSQLKQLPVDIIKIDGSFVKDIVYNPESKFFVKTLLEFSRNFGLKSVAEFVENGEIAETLSQMNVDYMQGNYFSPAVNYRAWLG